MEAGATKAEAEAILGCTGASTEGRSDPPPMARAGYHQPSRPAAQGFQSPAAAARIVTANDRADRVRGAPQAIRGQDICPGSGAAQGSSGVQASCPRSGAAQGSSNVQASCPGSGSAQGSPGVQASCPGSGSAQGSPGVQASCPGSGAAQGSSGVQASCPGSGSAQGSPGAQASCPGSGSPRFARRAGKLPRFRLRTRLARRAGKLPRFRRRARFVNVQASCPGSGAAQGSSGVPASCPGSGTIPGSIDVTTARRDQVKVIRVRRSAGEYFGVAQDKARVDEAATDPSAQYRAEGKGVVSVRSAGSDDLCYETPVPEPIGFRPCPAPVSQDPSPEPLGFRPHPASGDPDSLDEAGKVKPGLNNLGARPDHLST